MWTRALLKANAKTVLRRSYWRVFLVCLIAALLDGSFDINLNINLDNTIGIIVSPEVPLLTDFASLAPGVSLLLSVYLQAIAVVGTLLLLAMAVVGLAWSIFFAPVIQVGRCRYMIGNRAGPQSLSILFSGFGPGYGKVIWEMFMMNLRVFLFSLLLLIPGVVKRYQYTFVPYLLAENPELPRGRAAELSTLMTAGEKWNIFALDLSFIGWNILGTLLLGIGNLFVTPYTEATRAELYAAMRAKAIAAGWTSEAELSGPLD